MRDMDTSYDWKRILAFILIVISVLAGVIAFTDGGTFLMRREKREVAVEIQKKQEEAVTAFDGKVTLPIKQYYLVTEIGGTEHRTRVSKSQYDACGRKAVFILYYDDDQIIKIVYKGPYRKEISK